MYLTALTQRDRLFDIAARWLRGDVHEDDACFVTEVFLIDPLVTAPVLTSFLSQVTMGSATTPKVEHLRMKGEVRRRIAGGWRCPTPRAAELFARYRERPEEFFPTTPVDLFAVSGRQDDLLAMVRFKNLTRIAHKTARRAAAALDPEVRRRTGMALPDLTSGTLDAEHARLLGEVERTLCLEIGNGDRSFSREDLRLDDVIGAKLIGEASDLAHLEESLLAHPQVVSASRSEHHGAYNDVCLELELACSPPGPTIDRLLAADWSGALARGLDTGEVGRAIPRYVESAQRTFFVDVILTTWEELVESEFGRGLHEERTERQHTEVTRAGHLVTNVGLASLFLLLVAMAPTVTVGEPPIKMSGRYLPDTVAAFVASLFGLNLDRSPLSLPPVDADSPHYAQRHSGAAPLGYVEAGE